MSIYLQRAVTMIPAHDSPVASMAFNHSGTKLATASEKVNNLSYLYCHDIEWYVQ